MLLVVGMTTLVVLAFAVPVGVLLNSALVQHAERVTVDQANAVGVYLRSGNHTTTEIADYVTSLSENTGRPTSVLLADGTVLGTPPARDSTRPATKIPHDGGGPQPSGSPRGGPGPSIGTGPQSDATLRSIPGGEVADLAVLSGEGEGRGNYLVRVFVSDGALHSGEGRWWALLIGGSVGLLLIGVVAAELLTRRIVRPLTRTAETANRISAGDTAARAPVDGPREVAAVGSALNRLADRIDELIADERETVADLSHRLRTPLTALRLDAEALRDPVERERVGTHVSALERTLTAVIHAARRPQREGRLPSCDATAVVGDRVRFWSALADDQNRTMTVRVPATSVEVRASGDDLAAAVDALLENVFAHTPEGVPLSVELAADAPGARLCVSDDGPGLSPDALARGRSDRGSSGLGLSIARRCAEVSGGSMTIDAGPSGGAVITLRLGAP